jgi:transposase
MAYSMDFRQRVAAAHAESGSSAEVAEAFGCSEAWVRRLTQRLRERGTPAPRSTARTDDRRAYDDADEAEIRALIKDRPDATLAGVAAAVGKPAPLGAVSRTHARAAAPRAKKKSTHAAERDRPDVVAKRGARFARFADKRAADLVSVDEFGANTKVRRTHGRAAPGERVVGRVPHGHCVTVSTTGALSLGGLVASASFDGGTTAARFVAFVRERLVPALRPGRVVVLDNLAAHNDRRVDEPVEAAGCAVLRLPPYSPDYNPIEQAISKVKTMLRKLAKRTVPDLLDGIAEALRAVTPADAAAYIAHCGYATERRNPL